MATASSSRRTPPRTDHTADFRQLVSQQAEQYPPPKGKLSRSDLPPNVIKAQRQWLQQAYTIRRHIISLLAFLSSIRRPYLSLSSSKAHRPVSAGQPSLDDSGTPQGSDELGSSSVFAKWSSYQGPLTDSQRDEIDFQVKVVVKRCLESIKELELAEQARKKTAPTTPTALSPLHTLLSLSTPADSSSSIFASSLIASHRSSVIHYLSTLLSKASGLQSDMQEKRLKAQREKSRSLANSRAQLQAERDSQAPSGPVAPIKGSLGGSYNPAIESEAHLVGKDITSQLTPQQIQMFESESSDLIKSLESELAAIRKAESRLYEISDLQTQVAQQLEQQGEVTDRLMDEAIGVGTEVGKGNEELRKARERSREADKMLAAFLVGSGLTLLFLHWMD